MLAASPIAAAGGGERCSSVGSWESGASLEASSSAVSPPGVASRPETIKKTRCKPEDEKKKKTTKKL
jgi:hypothetical protein